jgi:NADH dehydrogenase (ubiquinone) 1 alpha subcomplex subunit 2
MSWQKSIGKALREIRFVVSNLSQADSPTTQFIRQNYTPIKKEHPSFPFIVRECQGVDDFVVFQYDFGVERKQMLKGLDAQQIEQVVEQHVSQAKAINSTL